jgi:FimV-like protein
LNALELPMSRGSYPILLLLAMSLPGAARAIGLGEIHVDSALNEPLSAQIDIVGATRDDLAVLTAKIANREVFQRYGADRPSFLTTATFKVGLNAQGHPVLNVKSADAFTDPVVSFLVDLHYGNGELIREYSLLLDPASFAPSHAEATVAAVAPAAAPAPAPVAEAPTTRAAAPAGRSTSKHRSAQASDGAPPVATISGAQHRVATKDTLRGIARRAGARTESQAQRLMLAIFRANPDAFDGNINLLHLGAVLDIPAAGAVEAIDATEARKEVRAQMTAWRLDGRPTTSHRAAALGVAPAAAVADVSHVAVSAAPAGAPTATTGSEATTDALKNRVASLEQALDTMRQQLMQLTGHNAAVAASPATAAPQVQLMREVPQATPTPAVTTSPIATSGAHSALLSAMAASLALLLGGFAFMRRRALRSRAIVAPGPTEAPADAVRTLAAAAPLKAEAMPQAKAVQSQRITVREIPDPPIVSEIRQRELSEEADQNMFVDTEALERSYLDSLGIDTHGAHEHIDAEQIDAAFSAETADSTQELPGNDSALGDTASLHQSGSFDTLSREISREILRDATGARDAVGLDTVAIDASDLEAELRDANPNTVVLGTLKVGSEAEDDQAEFEAEDDELDGDMIGHSFPPRVSLTGSNPIAIDATPPGATALDYNLLDLDATAQHVQMPSELNDHVVVSERRTNIIDVLKLAIDRDPHRRDLRMKLLETYYGAASMNQRAFLEVVRRLARDRDFLNGDDWKKVMMMGRDIAAEDILFADPVKDDDLADCA